MPYPTTASEFATAIGVVSGPSHYWHFDQASGVCPDLAGDAPLSPDGGPSQGIDAPDLKSKVVRFDADSAAKMVAADDTKVQVADESICVIWIGRLNSVPAGNDALFGKRSATAGWYVRMAASGVADWNVESPAGVDSTNSPNFESMVGDPVIFLFRHDRAAGICQASIWHDGAVVDGAPDSSLIATDLTNNFIFTVGNFLFGASAADVAAVAVFQGTAAEGITSAKLSGLMESILSDEGVELPRAMVPRPPFHREPESPIEQRISYLTDVQRSYDGTEKRVRIRQEPVQSFTYRYSMATEADMQAMREALFAGLDAPEAIPLWHEAFYLAAAVSAGATSITTDRNSADIFNGGLTVLFWSPGNVEVATVSSAGGAITLSAGLANAYPKGAAIVPLENALVSDGASIARKAVGAAMATIRFRLDGQPPLGYTDTDGSLEPDIAMHRSIPVIDSRPLAKQDATETFSIGFDVVESVNRIKRLSGKAFAQIGRPAQFLARTRLAWQKWKFLISEVAGGHKPVLVPTWRDDLFLDSQPSIGASTIDVQNAPVNYKTTYDGHLGHSDLQLETNNGILYREISSSVDLGNGATRIALGEALPADTTIDRISYLELSRMSDEITVRHMPTHRIISLELYGVEA